jgi:coenzyme F420 biosynthesis associated uncharacterized protein
VTEARPEVIDWALAKRVAQSLAGNGSGKRSIRQADLKHAARGCVGLVRGYTGLTPSGRLPAAEVVDRREWIEANIASLRSMSATVEGQLSESLDLPGPLGSGLRGAAGLAAGAELGIASGLLAQRVLGQYDVALIGPARPPRLLFVAPNLAEAQKRIGADREPFLRWIALHEATHVVQFASVPWLRPHIGAIGEELLSAALMRVGIEELARFARRLLGTNPRRILAAIRDGEWLSPFVAEPRRRLLRRLQTTMAVVEGYSEHVMDAIGAQLDPAVYGPLREQVERRRDGRNPIEAILSRLLGTEMKLRQYRQGKAFCDEVADRRGIEVLNRVWLEPAMLPRPSELERPGRWISRVA